MSRRVVAVGISILLAGSAQHLAAQSCTGQLYPKNSAGSILVISSDSHISAEVVAGGVGMWRLCSQYGCGFPSLLTTGSGDISFDVALVGGVSTSISGGCGELRAIVNASTGQVIGGTIALFDVTRSGHDCEPIRSETIAHELGHALGLDDLSAENCNGHIMGPPLIGGSRAVQADECAAVDGLWLTPAELPGGGAFGGTDIFNLLELPDSNGWGGWWTITVGGTSVWTNGGWCLFPNGSVVPCG
jgi:hypothetical protein